MVILLDKSHYHITKGILKIESLSHDTETEIPLSSKYPVGKVVDKFIPDDESVNVYLNDVFIGTTEY